MSGAPFWKCPGCLTHGAPHSLTRCMRRLTRGAPHSFAPSLTASHAACGPHGVPDSFMRRLTHGMDAPLTHSLMICLPGYTRAQRSTVCLLLGPL